MSEDTYDYIIVGSGLAGITLAMQMHWRGKRIILFTGTKKNTSSYVAAGLYNPITGRKMVKTWEADKLFPYLKDFYQKVEVQTESSFLHDLPIYRPFLNTEEQNEWMGKSAEDSFKPYINQVYTQPFATLANDQYGGLKLAYSGYLDIPAYIENSLEFLGQHHTIVRADLDYRQLKLGEQKVSYNSNSASKVIFCEGTAMGTNPYFNWLPIRPVKGEILFIRLPFATNYILNRGVFVLPTGDGIYKAGSTYDHFDLSLEPTEKGRGQILEKLQEILNVEVDIVRQIAGIRPATKDRRPLIGLHPKFETIGVFNGLGTKGVSLAPYWSEQFVNHLEKGKKLHDDVNISRYFSLYSESRESNE